MATQLLLSVQSLFEANKFWQALAKIPLFFLPPFHSKINQISRDKSVDGVLGNRTRAVTYE